MIGTILIAAVAVVAAVGAMLPKAHVATRRAHYRRAPQAIWDAITGPPDWRPEVGGFEKLPERDGHRVWRELDKHGRAVTFEEMAAEPVRMLEVRIADVNLPYGGGWTYEITPDANGGFLRVTERGEVYNPIFRFISRFVIGHTASLEQYLSALGKKFGESTVVEE